MTSPILTAAARRHGRLLLRAIGPSAGLLDRRLRAVLRERKYEDAAVRALLAVTPAAASRLRTFRQFLEQVEYNGRRLAKLNVSPSEVSDALARFDDLLTPLVDGQFLPAREQLRLASLFSLNRAFYQVREAETQAFFGVYLAEAEAGNLEDLLQRFVRVLTQAFRARTGRLLLQNGAGNPKLTRPLYIEHGRPDECLVADDSMRGQFASYWSYPLRDAGFIQFGFDVPYPWLPRELTLLDAVANRCMEAIERARLRDEVSRLEAEARRTEHEERRRIGRELHDEAGQSLLFLRLKVEMLERSAPVELRAELGEIRGIAVDTVVQLRRIIAALSPSVLERLGLKQALYQQAARFRKMHPAQVRLQFGVNSEEIPRPIQEVIYRVAQECLQNIAKHSHATRVNLFVRSADMRIKLSVRDNGAGFSGDLMGHKPQSFGLAGMRARAALLGGTLVVRNHPGKGVTVTLDLPSSLAPVNRNGMSGNGEDSSIVDRRSHPVSTRNPNPAGG